MRYRSISQIISTIILVTMVIGLSTLTYLFLSGTITQLSKTSTYGIQQVNNILQCNNVKGEVIIYKETYSSVNTSNNRYYFTDFRYRVPITIKENSGNNLIDYPINITIDTASLISQGKMKTDCGDIRFTYVYPNGTEVKIPYWLDFGCNTQNTRIWVKVPSIPANGQVTIYMYYGNPYATSESNEAEVDVWQLREFDYNSSYDPDIIFTVPNTSIIRIDSYTNGASSVGRGYLFTQIPRSWVDGMDTYIHWRGYSSYTGLVIIGEAYIFNATLHRMDTTQYMVPNSSREGIFNISNRRLGVYMCNCSNAWYIWLTSISNRVNLTGYNDYVTLLIRLIDNWVNETVMLDIDNIRIVIPSIVNGTSSLFKRFDFDGCVIMEVTGTTNDYGVFRKCISPEPFYTLGQEENIQLTQPSSFEPSLVINLTNLGIDLGNTFNIRITYIDGRIEDYIITLNQTLKSSSTVSIPLYNLTSGVIRNIKIYSIDICPNTLIVDKYVNIEV